MSRADATASSYIPTLKLLIKFVADRKKSTRESPIKFFLIALHDALTYRASKIFSNKILQMATLLDPRFKYDTEYLSDWGELEDYLCQYAYNRKNCQKINM